MRFPPSLFLFYRMLSFVFLPQKLQIFHRRRPGGIKHCACVKQI